jgi:hypothetical protein
MLKTTGLLGALCALMVYALPASADGKPDAVALLKGHPEFVSMTMTTNLGTGEQTARITLCRDVHARCETFDSDGKSLTGLADYAYLCAVYKDDCTSGKHTKSKTNADGLQKEATDKGYGQALLDHYGMKYDCAHAKDATACILHHLFLDTGIRRSIAIHNGNGFMFMDADETGNGDPFGD